LPLTLLVLCSAPTLLAAVSQMPRADAWLTRETAAWPWVQLYRVEVPPVEELRPLAALPAAGDWWPVERYYSRFERWFSDHLGGRNLMIRAKNELDYRLFNSSTRVYYGAQDELYGRNLIDNEMPATERLLADPARAQAVYDGVLAFNQQLRRQGVTMLLVAPIQKQYYTRERLPAFAPHVPQQSNFLALSQRLQAAPQLQMIDVKRHLDQNRNRFPLFYKQDFHWTDLTAMVVAADVTGRIARLESSPLRWRHAMQPDYQPFVGSEARFAARLNADQPVLEPQLKQTWTPRHHDTPAAADSGWEFSTDVLDDAALLPPTCMYGNSFSDGMLRAGLSEHFRQFHKLSRTIPLTQVPALLHGQCRYLIVQVLDIQTNHWASLAPAP
jgi:alginate O-acetyltransferase complex protein AlgJ